MSKVFKDNCIVCYLRQNTMEKHSLNACPSIKSDECLKCQSRNHLSSRCDNRVYFNKSDRLCFKCALPSYVNDTCFHSHDCFAHTCDCGLNDVSLPLCWYLKRNGILDQFDMQHGTNSNIMTEFEFVQWLKKVDFKVRVWIK